MLENAGTSIGRKGYEFVPPDQAEHSERLLRSVFETGERITFETGAVNVDGDSGWYLNTLSPLHGEDGAVRFAVLMTRDITDRRNAERAIERALEQERAAVARMLELDELKSGFVANVVHDLRTPITVIQGFAATLEQRWDEFSDVERRRFLSYMSSGTHRLMRLVDDVLLASRLETGEMPLQVADFDLAAMLRTVASELSHGTEATFEFDLPEVVIAHADELRMRQVAVNLYANAMRYAPHGTSIEVGVGRSGETWTVEVRDHGRGISAQDQERLFQRFSQVDATDGGHGGSGLGLFICRSIIEAHGGDIGMDSEPGEGARFWFTVAAAGD